MQPNSSNIKAPFKSCGACGAMSGPLVAVCPQCNALLPDLANTSAPDLTAPTETIASADTVFLADTSTPAGTIALVEASAVDANAPVDSIALAVASETADAMPPKSKENRPNFGKTFGLVAILTVVSKFVGFARDVIVASAYGTGALADAYNYAYAFTGNILILFGGLGGPFHSATVAVLTREKDKPESGLLMAQVMAATSVLLGTLSIALYFLAPYLMHALAGQYTGMGHHTGADVDTFFRESILQLKWMSPLVLIAGLIGVTYGILNVYNKMTWPSLSPAIASVAIIIAVKFFSGDQSSSLPLAIASLIGACGQLLAQIPDLARCKVPWQFSFKPAPELKHYLSMLWPACLGTLIGQVTMYVDIFFCSQIGEGGWTAIINANRLVQLPLGILTTAMLVPMLPRFSELAHRNEFDALKNEYGRALRFMVFLSMPLAALLLALPKPIVHTLFERHNFTAESTALVSAALFGLVPSIVFYVGRDLITRVFYAMKDSKTPYYVALVAILVKAVLDWIVVTKFGAISQLLGLNIAHSDYQFWQVGGLSLATTLITIMNLSLLTFALRRKIGRLDLSKTLKPMAMMLVAGTLCGALSFGIFFGLMQMFGHANMDLSQVHTFQSLCFVGVSCTIGMLAYVIACISFKLEELDMLKRRIPASVLKALKLDS
jgi:putative peptidoglycan lipid II flippase